MFGYVDGECVVPGTARRFLSVHAVERHGNPEAGWVTSSTSKSYLGAVATGDQTRERGVRTGAAEIIKESRGPHELAVQCRKCGRATDENAKNPRSEIECGVHGKAAGCGGGVNVGGRQGDGKRTTETQASRICVLQVVGKQHRIG